MGTGDRKLTLTVMVAAGTFVVGGLATGNIGVVLLSTLILAALALTLIWNDGAGPARYRTAPDWSSGQRAHGGCLTAFMLVWAAFELFALVKSIVTPSPDAFVNWDALARYGELLVALHVALFYLLPICRVGCLLGVWVWWRRWCVLGFLFAGTLDLSIELAGRALLGPPSASVQSSPANLEVAALGLIILVFLVFAELARREWALLE